MLFLYLNAFAMQIDQICFIWSLITLRPSEKIIKWSYCLERNVGWPYNFGKFWGMTLWYGKILWDSLLVTYKLTNLRNDDSKHIYLSFDDLKCKYNIKYLFINEKFVCIFCGKKIKMLYLTLDGSMNLKKIVGWSYDPRKNCGIVCLTFMTL